MQSEERKNLPATDKIKISPELLAELENIPDSRPGTRGIQWTEEMDEVLRRYWGKKPQADLCRVLGVSKNSARERWKYLSSQS